MANGRLRARLAPPLNPGLTAHNMTSSGQLRGSGSAASNRLSAALPQPLTGCIKPSPGSPSRLPLPATTPLPPAASAGSSPAPCNGRDDDDAAAAAAVLDRIKQQFAGRASAYDTGNSYHPPLAQKLLELVQPQPGEALLDLACGTGIVALPAAELVGPGGRVVGVDISQEMLDEAAKKAAAAGLTDARGRVAFCCGNIESLEEALDLGRLGGSFDAITCSAASPFLQRPRETFAAWRRWLRPGSGRLAFNAFVAPAMEEHGLFVRMAREAGAEQEIDPCEALGSEAAVRDALTCAGYSSMQIIPEARTRWMPAASPMTHAENIWRMSINNNPFRAPEDLEASLGGPEALEAFKTEFLAAAVEAVESCGRFDAASGRVVNAYSMLHVMAVA